MLSSIPNLPGNACAPCCISREDQRSPRRSFSPNFNSILTVFIRFYIMGGAASVLKKFYQRLIRRRRRDRWVRDDKKRLLPAAPKSKRGSTNHVLPKRIDEKVFDQILQEQGLTRRSAEVEEPGWSIHEDIHRRQLVILQGGYDPSSPPVAESFDSMASWIRDGTERMGPNFYTMDGLTEKKDWDTGLSTDEEEELKADYDSVKWVRMDFDNVGNCTKLLEPIDEAADEEQTVSKCDDEQTTTLDEDDFKEGTMEDETTGTMGDDEDEATGTMGDDEDETTETMGDDVDDYDDIDFDEDNQMPDEKDNQEEGMETFMNIRHETTGAYALERFALEIHTCSSGDASWCDDVLV